MPEPMSRELVGECLKTLAAAFPQRLSPEQHDQRNDVYRNGLSGLSGDALRFAVKISMQEDNFFPKVARLRQIAQRWVTAHPPSEQTDDPLYCRGCQQRAHLETRWRPQINAHGQRIHDATTGRLALETFERYQCACSAPSQWHADAADDPWMTVRS